MKTRTSDIDATGTLDSTNFLRGDGVWASPGGGGGGNWWYDPPLAADFTLTSGDATNLTLTDDADEGLLFDPGTPAGTNINRTALITLTDKTLDWDLVVRISAVLPTNYVTAYGPCIYDSISGRLTALEMISNSNWTAVNSTTLASGATRTNALTADSAPFRTIGPYWMRINHVGTNYNFYRSVNGKNWQLHGTVTDTSFLTNRGDKVGFTVMTASAGGADKKAMGNITYWSLTGPGV